MPEGPSPQLFAITAIPASVPLPTIATFGRIRCLKASVEGP